MHTQTLDIHHAIIPRVANATYMWVDIITHS